MRPWGEFDGRMSVLEPNSMRELFDIYIEERIIGKERVRAGFRTPVKTRVWTDIVGKVCAEQMEGRPSISFPVCARVLFGLRDKKRRADIDNMEKALWDGFQRGDESGRGRVIDDDRLVRGYVEKGETLVGDKEPEFIWVRLYACNKADFDAYEGKYGE